MSGESVVSSLGPFRQFSDPSINEIEGVTHVKLHVQEIVSEVQAVVKNVE